MQGVAKKYKLEEQTQFNTQVTRAEWREQAKKWEVELRVAGNEEAEIRFYDFM